MYLRVSLDSTGEQLAISRQRADCLRIIEQRGWSVHAEYVDNSISASDSRKQRPGYDALLRDYEEGRYDALVCWDLDRLTRQPRQLEDWVDAAEQRGLMVVTANGEADLSTDGGRMFARIKIAVARSEIERKSARRKAANRQRAQKGVPPKGVRLTGYGLDGQVMADEAANVVEVFARFDQGDTLKGIARWLTGEHVPTRRGGDVWNPSSVLGILTNPRYCGRLVYRPVKGAVEQHAGAWEPIIDEALFDRVQLRLADPRRKTSREGTDRKYLGGGLYRCGECGGSVSTYSGKRYRCRRACLIRAVAGIDMVVVETVRLILARPDLTGLLADPDDGKAAELTAQIEALQARIDRTEADYDNDLIDGARYAAKSGKLRAEMSQRLAERARLHGDSGLAAMVAAADPVAAFDAAPLGIQRSVINSLVDVRLHRAPRGRKTFDRSTISITPKAAALTGAEVAA